MEKSSLNFCDNYKIPVTISIFLLLVIFVFPLISASPWNIDTAVFEKKLSYDTGGYPETPFGMFINETGNKFYVVLITSNYPDMEILEYNLTSNWDIGTRSAKIGSLAVHSQTYGIYINPDGTKLFTTGNDRVIRQYKLATAWNISSASYNGSINFTIFAPLPNTPIGISLKPDGTKMYVGGHITGNEKIFQFSLSTPWDITTATLDKSASVLSGASGLYIRKDGGKLYEGGGVINQYEFTIPWDISTLTLEHQVNFYLYQPVGLNIGVFFENNGLKMYLSAYTSGGSTTDDGIYQWKMDATPQRINDFSSGELTVKTSYFINGYYSDYSRFNVSWFDSTLNSTQTISKLIGEGNTTIYGDLVVTLDGILNFDNILFQLNPLNADRTVNFTVRAINNVGYDEQKFTITTIKSEFLEKGLASTVIKGFTDLFPDKETLGSSERFAYALFVIIVTVVGILVVGKESISLALILASVISIMEFIYFVFIGYISIGIVIILVLIGIILTYFKFRSV